MFHEKYTPTQCQLDIWQQIQDAWDTHDVFVVVAAVALGKTVLGDCVMRYAGENYDNGGAYITKDNVLLQQVIDDLPGINSLKRQDLYRCDHWQTPCSKVQAPCKGCHLVRDKIRSQVRNTGAYTFYGYMANKLNRDVVIIDEATSIIPTLRDLNTQTLWRHKYHWTEPIDVWVNSLSKEKLDKKTRLLKRIVNEDVGNWIAKSEDKEFDGHPGQAIDLIPLWGFNSMFWKYPTKKVILMSATISPVDVALMGLDHRDVKYIYADSPIPPERRPWQMLGVTDLSLPNRAEQLPLVAQWVNYIASSRPGRGLVHAPYSIAKTLKGLFRNNPRYIFHSKKDKDEAIARFRNTPGAILVASGIYEGVSFPYDDAEWQVCTTALFANIGDPVVSAMIERWPKWYDSEAAKLTAQVYGRVCRRPDDRGETLFLDIGTTKLYKRNPGLFAKWFKDAERVDIQPLNM